MNIMSRMRGKKIITAFPSFLKRFFKYDRKIKKAKLAKVRFNKVATSNKKLFADFRLKLQNKAKYCKNEYTFNFNC